MFTQGSFASIGVSNFPPFEVNPGHTIFSKIENKNKQKNKKNWICHEKMV